MIRVVDGPVLTAQHLTMKSTKLAQLKPIATRDLNHVSGGSPTLPLPPPAPPKEEALRSLIGNQDGTGRT